jgi:hypothetical protein
MCLRPTPSLGASCCVWYGITPERAGFDVGAFALGMVQLPLYSVLFARLMERAGGGLLIALALHAGGHLDQLERAPDATPLVLLCHVIVLGLVTALAARGRLARPSIVRRLRGPGTGVRQPDWS